MAIEPHFDRPPGGPPPGDLGEVLNVARSLVAQEFARTDRLDAKARGLVQLAAQWYAITQAVLAVAINQSDDKGSVLLIVAGFCAIAGGIALAITFGLSSGVWKVRSEEESTPDALLAMAQDARDPTVDAQRQLVRNQAAALRRRRDTNKLRASALERSEAIWYYAMALPLLELALALAAVFFS